MLNRKSVAILAAVLGESLMIVASSAQAPELLRISRQRRKWRISLRNPRARHVQPCAVRPPNTQAGTAANTFGMVTTQVNQPRPMQLAFRITF